MALKYHAKANDPFAILRGTCHLFFQDCAAAKPAHTQPADYPVELTQIEKRPPRIAPWTKPQHGMGSFAAKRGGSSISQNTPIRQG
jgi:hypothetical protein